MDSKSHKSNVKVLEEDKKLAWDTVGVGLPVSHFGQEFESVEQMLTDLIVSVSKETACIDSHLTNEPKDDPVMSHLRNTNQTIGSMLSMLDQLFHYNHHSIESQRNLDKVETKTKNLDEKFNEHEPMLKHVSDTIKEVKKRDERGRQIYEQ